MSAKHLSLKIASLDDLGQETMTLIRNLSDEDGTLLVTGEGEPAAVVLSPDTYRQLQNQISLLRRLALGELECKAGEGYSLDQVLADCDLLLEEN